MTTEEKNEMKMIENIEKDIENTGRWWELWESEEAKEYFAQIGCSEVIEIAIPELKKTFTAEDYTKMVNKKREAIETEQFKSSAYDTARYLELMDYDHPLISPLLFHVPTEFDKKIAKHPNPINFFNVTPVMLGFAIKELGGFEKLSENAIGDLKSAKNFQDRFYEIVVEAFFKMFYKDSTITFPEENLLNKGSKKPDMSIDDMMYVEIKNLNMSDYEKRIHKIIEKEITDTIRKRTKDFKGSVGYNISFDQVGFDPKEIMKAAETTKKLIESVEVKPGKVIVKKEGGVSIELNFTPDNDRQLSGSIIGLGQSERNDIFRIYRILTSSKKVLGKNPGDLPMILVIQPSTPMVGIKDENYREILGVELFTSAISKDERVKLIKELWIDITPFVLMYEEVKRKLSDPTSSLSRSFIKIRNPFYEELPRSVDL